MPSAKRPKTTPKPKPVHRTPVSGISPDEQIVGAPFLGKVRSYDAKKHEMTLLLEESVSTGDAVRVKGRDTDLSQRVERLSVARHVVQSALTGETVVFSVADRVRVGDAVYKVRSS
jgi:hypothetical protein